MKLKYFRLMKPTVQVGFLEELTWRLLPMVCFGLWPVVIPALLRNEFVPASVIYCGRKVTYQDYEHAKHFAKEYHTREDYIADMNRYSW